MEKLNAAMHCNRWRGSLKTSLLNDMHISQEEISPGTGLSAPLRKEFAHVLSGPSAMPLMTDTRLSLLAEDVLLS
jgi:hypothetical protein